MVAEAEQTLRSAVADGINRLNADNGGRFLATISRRLQVQRSTVSRWSRCEATALPEHCDLLARAWPGYFNRDQLAELQYSLLGGDMSVGMSTVGAAVHNSPESVYTACCEALLEEPVPPQDRVARITSFNLDHHGINPAPGEPLFSGSTQSAVEAYRDALAQRAAEGWKMQMVLAVGTNERAIGARQLVELLEGPNVEVYGYVGALPLVVAPVVVANRDVLVVYDHRRWERPGSAIVLRSRNVVSWANRYFSELIADAPHCLRSPVGVNQQALRDYLEEIAATSAAASAGAVDQHRMSSR